MSGDWECCASGSCEVCRMPQGYTPADRERFARNAQESDWNWYRAKEDRRPI